MRVFLSWSGERSKAVASALWEWLRDVLHYVEPWMSQNDIAAGERWSLEVAKELEASNFGIVCLTKDNLNARWLLFEAGALSKRMAEGAVVPYLFDVDFSAILNSPLSLFQGKKANKEDTLALVLAINAHATSGGDEQRVRRLVDKFWPDLEQQFKAITALEASNAKVVERPQHEILEEIVTVIRAMDQRIAQVELAVRASNTVTPIDERDNGPVRVVLPQVGVMIKQHRVEQNMAKKLLADTAHIAYSTLVSIEEGDIKKPSFAVVSRIAAALGLPVELFLVPLEELSLAAEHRR